MQFRVSKGDGLLGIPLLLAFLVNPWVCQAQFSYVTSTFGGEFHSHSEHFSDCKFATPPTWAPEGNGFQLNTSINGCNYDGVRPSNASAGVQINVSMSPTTIAGAVFNEVGYLNDFYLQTPFTVDVTATVTPSGVSKLPTLTVGWLITGSSDQLTQCQESTVTATSIHATCVLTPGPVNSRSEIEFSRDEPTLPTHDYFGIVVDLGFTASDTKDGFGGEFYIEPQFTEGAGSTDSISLNNVTPDSSQTLAPQPTQFSASAQYTLSSAATGTVTLQLSDETNTVIGQSQAVAVNKGTSSIQLTIPSVSLPGGTNLTLTAVLQPAGGTAVTSSAINYTVGCPISTGQARKGPADDGGNCGGGASITLDYSKPAASQPLAAVLGNLPPFCGTGSYTYTGKNQAQVQLELLDENGQMVAHSVRGGSLGNGTNQQWGLRCEDNKYPDLIFITETPLPKFDFPPGTPNDFVLATYQLQASLYDGSTGAKLATSNQVAYNVVPGISGTAALVLHSSTSPSPDLPVDLSQPIQATINKNHTSYAGIALDAARTFAPGTNYDTLLLRVGVDLSVPYALLDAETIVLDGDGNNVTVGSNANPQPVRMGHNQVDLRIGGFLRPTAASLTIYPRVTINGDQVYKLAPILLLVDSIGILSITPDPAKCDLVTDPQDCLVKNNDNKIEARLGITPQQPGETYLFTPLLFHTEDQNAGSPPQQDLKPPPLTVNALNRYDFNYTIPLKYLTDDVTEVTALFNRPGTVVATSAKYTSFTTREAQIAVSNVAQTFQGVDSKLSGILSKAGRVLSSGKKAAQILTVASEVDQAAHFHAIPGRSSAKLSGKAANATPSFLPINSAWQFNPPIPQDGSFSATLSLNYYTSDFPDDPNFVESNLQIVSIDPNGTVHTYPTSLDTTNKVASASINGLDPYYTLAVAGPFSQTPAMLATAGTGYALVNTGSQDVNLSLTTYASDGTANPATPVLKSNSQTQSSSSSWVQAWPNLSTVTGVSWFDNGSVFAVNPAQTPAQFFIFTDVEYDAGKSTEIDLANTTPFGADVTLDLFASDGSLQGTYTQSIDSKASVTARVESLFPGLTPGFSGYVVVGSHQTLAASGYRWTGLAAAGLTAQPITDASLAARQWFAPHLGGIGTQTTLHLVNFGQTPANVTLKAWGADGSAAASNVNLKLAVGQQYSQPISKIFGINSSLAGSIEVDSDANGVFSDVLVQDASFFSSYSFSFPLVARGMTASVLPYATPNTTVLVFNPNSSATTVTATPYGTDGTAGSGPSVSIAPFGLGSLGVSATGYVTIGSSQPVVAAGKLVVASGTTTGYVALPAASAIVNPAGPAPQVSAGGITNAAVAKTTLARGALATIYGSNFTAGTTSFQAQTLPLPYTLGGVSVSVAGVPAPLYFVNADQINFQVPYGVPVGSLANVVVTANGSATPAASVAIADYAIGVFSYFRTSTAYDPIIVHNSTNALVSPSNPATPGETVVIYGTGAGRLSGNPIDGLAVAGLVQTVDTPAVTVNGAAAKVLFSGLTPGAVGLMQLDVTLPASLPSGSLPLLIRFPSDSAPSVNLAVRGNTSGSGGPALSLSTTSLSFGNVTLGQTKDLSLTASNVGTATLTVNSASVTGAGFSLTTPASFNIAAGGSQTLTVRYAPSTSTSANGTLTIASNDPNSPASISLSGTGIAVATSPTISATASNTDFGNVNTGSNKDLTVTVSNTGTAALTVSASFTPSPPFSVVSPTGSFSLNPGSSQSLTIRFAPTAAGAQTATLTLTSNDPVNPAVTFKFTGTGVASSGGGSGNIVSLKVESGTYNTTTSTFSTPPAFMWDTDNSTTNWVIGVSLPGASNPLLNSPGKALTGANPQLTPGSYFTYYTPYTWASDIRLSVGWSNGVTDVGYFHVAGFNDNTVWPFEAGASNLAVTFKNLSPAAFKVFQASPQPGGASSDVLLLTINSGTGGGSPGGGASISASPQSLDFGSVPIGQTSAPKTVTLTNSGTAQVTVNLVTSPPFAVTPTSLTLPANGGAGTASVKFSPTTTASSGSNLNITISGQSTPVATVALTGSGSQASTTDVTLSVDGGAYDFEVGYPSGVAAAYFVDRLTPPSYPATIKSVEVFFSTRSDGVTLNQPITILSMTDPSGTSALGPGFAGTTDQVNGLINALDVFLNYTVPQRTITAGDFVVGFKVQNPPNIYPADEDTLTPSAHRSYTSTDGVNYTLLDSISANGGNLAIRAVVSVGK